MPSPNRTVRSPKVSRAIVFMTIVSIMLPLSASSRPRTTRLKALENSSTESVLSRVGSFFGLSAGQSDDFGENEASKVFAGPLDSVYLCPQAVNMYVGEDRTLHPVALDANKEVIYSAVFTWTSSNLGAVSVSAGGTIEALGVGTSTVTATTGSLSAVVTVTVLAGERPEIPESDPEFEGCPGDSPNVIIPPPTGCEEPPARNLADIPPLDGGEGDENQISLDVLDARNGVGTPYNQAVAKSGGSPQPVPMADVLGSSNYTFTAPILGIGGREIDLGLPLVYNSQLWTYDAAGDTMTFNYDKGWPAAGWRLGYGRIIKDYDGLNTNHHLLITPNGTRVVLLPDSSSPAWTHSASDGSYIRMKVARNGSNQIIRMTVLYPDGMQARFVNIAGSNSKWLPDQIKTRNGNFLTITYRPYDPEFFPVRWAINSIKDSVGRTFMFKYGVLGIDGKCIYGALRTIEGPGPDGQTVTYVKLDYDLTPLTPSFSGVFVQGSPADGDLLVIKRIIYPTTGRGYEFQNFSGYGMPKTISMRRGLNGTPGTTGVETASTTYVYNDAGTFSDGDTPEYIQRMESILDDAGANAQVSTFSYTRQEDASGNPVSVTTSSPSVASSPTIVTTIDPATGRQLRVDYQAGATPLRTIEYGYDATTGANQVKSVKVTEQGLTTETRYTYGNYDRLLTAREYSYGSSSVLRTTDYRYTSGWNNGTQYVDQYNLPYLVDRVRVYSGTETSGTLVAETNYAYDTLALAGYGLLSAITGHDLTNFGASQIRRGNVTSVTYSPISGNQTTPIIRTRSYDIFGNVVSADVSCCQVKTFAFSNATLYSMPNSVTNGASAPTLTTSFTYDVGVDPGTSLPVVHSGLVETVTSPGGQTSSYTYDPAWRSLTETSRRTNGTQDDVRTTVTYATVAGGFTNDVQSLSTKLEYRETYAETGAFSKSVTETIWFDGAGRTLRGGTLRADGNYDLTATQYDGLSRVTKTSNPYVGTGSPTFYWTMNAFDAISRPTGVTLPDGSTASTAYLDSLALGARTIEMTDPAGRKRKYAFDALGRLSATTEDPTGAAFVTTTSYDTLDNVTLVDQGGQKREYLYDGLSRLLFERTPEQAAPISYAGKSWSASYEYNDFGDVTKMVDARSIETHYGFDTLNRLNSVRYTGPGESLTSTVGVEATNSVTVSYYSGSGPSNGQVNTVSNTTGVEMLTYDDFSRVATNTRTIAGKGFTPSIYLYTTAGDAVGMKYPGYAGVSNNPKQLRINHDSRGRFSGLLQGTWNFTAGTFTTTKTHVSEVVYGTGNATPLALTSMKLGANVRENFTYSSSRLQLTHQDVKTLAGSPLMTFDYGYSAPNGQNAGQVTTITSSVNMAPTTNEEYVYDQMSRLISASKTVGAAPPDFIDTIGTYDTTTSSWFLRTSNTSGPADYQFTFGAGNVGFIAITGDWNYDGVDTPGLYIRSSGVFLEDENAGGAADYTFSFGPSNSNWWPIAGDWNGQSGDSVGLYDPTNGTFFLKNLNQSGGADVTFGFGPANLPPNQQWLPIAGDWDGDGDDTIGLYDPVTSTFYLRNSNTPGPADLTFVFGAGGQGYFPVAGDWDGDRDDTIGLYLPSNGTWLLRNTNLAGPADIGPFYFSTGGQPVTGDWNGTPSTGSSWSQLYGYDQWGNRTSMATTLASGTSVQQVTIALDAQGKETNRIATVNGVAQTYDANGNLTGDGVNTFAYDAANRLTAVKNAAGTVEIARYSYDAANRRVKQKVVATNQAIWSLWEGMHVVVEFSGTDTGNPTAVAAQYIFAGSRMIAREFGVDTLYVHPDRLSTRMLTNGSSGAISGTQSHRPFGEDDSSNNTTDKHRFTNYERDGASGLDYAMNRHYAGSFGRFSQPDPIEGPASNPQRLNRYLYTSGDPINLIDPSGLSPANPGETHSIDGLPVSADFFQRYGLPRLVTGSALLVPAGSTGSEYIHWLNSQGNEIDSVTYVLFNGDAQPYYPRIPFPDCVRSLLIRFSVATGFPLYVNWSKLKIVPWGLPAGNSPKGAFSAMTIYPDIYFAPGEYDPHTTAGIALIGHEVYHAGSQAIVGVGNFLDKYISDYKRGKAKGLSDEEAYKAIDDERAARQFQDRFRTWLREKYGNRNPCP